MARAVSDTGPINYLILIEQIDILPRLFDGVHISRVVADELSRVAAPSIVRNWIAKPPPWVSLERGLAVARSVSTALDEGERATIDLAAQLGSVTILMDDRAGVAFARSRGVIVTGTLGLLASAARRGLLDLPLAFIRLRATSFHIRQDVLDRILAEHDGE